MIVGRFLLSIGLTQEGLMADDIVPHIMDAAEEMESIGLLIRGEPIGEISVFHTSRLGILAMGITIQ